jgi:membrane-associated phospholipid phosphatase
LQRNNQIIQHRFLFLGLTVFFLLSLKVEAQNTDIDWLRKINSSGSKHADKFHGAISFSVYPAMIITPSAVFTDGLLQKDTFLINAGLCIAAGLALNAGITLATKYAINRDRPYITYPDLQVKKTENTPSMPSGHTSSAFAVATSLTLLHPEWYVTIPAFAWAGGVAYSRMYLGVHYPSDIIAGALAGSGTAWLTWYLNKKIFGKKIKRKTADNE